MRLFKDAVEWNLITVVELFVCSSLMLLVAIQRLLLPCGQDRLFLAQEKDLEEVLPNHCPDHRQISFNLLCSFVVSFLIAAFAGQRLRFRPRSRTI